MQSGNGVHCSGGDAAGNCVVCATLIGIQAQDVVLNCGVCIKPRVRVSVIDAQRSQRCHTVCVPFLPCCPGFAFSIAQFLGFSVLVHESGGRVGVGVVRPTSTDHPSSKPFLYSFTAGSNSSQQTKDLLPLELRNSWLAPVREAWPFQCACQPALF